LQNLKLWERLTKVEVGTPNSIRIIMSVPQESGTALASIIGSRAEVLKEWKSFRVDPGSLPAQWHSKFWGKSMAHEEQKWRDTQSPMPVEGSRLEETGVDMTEGEDSDDDFIKGCYFLDIDINRSETSRIWIRAEYIRIYKAVEFWYNFVVESSYSGRAQAAVITGQPGIGES